MSKKDKLLAKLRQRSRSFTWDETTTLMSACGFKLLNGSGGSSRMFVHLETRHKVRLHEPHPQNTLLPYMLDILIEGLEAVGEL